jgi:uncharacterized protein YjbI with pentapeptide repeats
MKFWKSLIELNMKGGIFILFFSLCLMGCQSNKNSKQVLVFSKSDDLKQYLLENKSFDSSTIIQNSNLNEIIIMGIKMDDLTFNNCLIVNSRLNASQMRKVLFSNCNLTDTKFDEAFILKTTYTNNKLFNSSWNDAVLRNVKFNVCDLEQSHLINTSIYKSIFINSNLKNIEFTNGFPKANSLFDSDTFLNCDLSNSRLRGIIKSCIFKNCQIKTLDVDYLTFENCKFENCKFIDIRNNNITLKDNNFFNSYLEFTNTLYFNDSNELKSNKGLLNNPNFKCKLHVLSFKH